MNTHKVLCISFDQTTSDARVQALIRHGYVVIAATDTRTAYELIGPDRYVAVIVGQGFRTPERRLLAFEAKTRCHTPVILISDAEPESDISADAFVSANDGADAIAMAVERVSTSVPVS